MQDLKNLAIAWVSSATSVFAAIEAKTVITVISAIVLPVIFFAIGKTVDVGLQIWLRKRDRARGPEEFGTNDETRNVLCGCGSGGAVGGDDRGDRHDAVERKAGQAGTRSGRAEAGGE